MSALQRRRSADMNWFKEGIGAAIAEAKSKGAIFAVVVKSEQNNEVSCKVEWWSSAVITTVQCTAILSVQSLCCS